MTTHLDAKTNGVKVVLWRVLYLNLLVSALKIGVGLFSGALSIVADGFHSFMDGSSNVIGLIALRIAQAPPDKDHPYGHRKAETLATMFIGILLIFAAYEILKSSASRLLEGSGPEVSPLSFGVMIFTIAVNLIVTTYEHRRGKTLNSSILLADAQHTRSDIWVSLSVIVGLIGIQLGWQWLDAGVGLGIACVIGYSAVKILNEAVNVLMDQAVLPTNEIEQLALSMPEVQSVERIRSRGQADETYVDLHVRVKPETPTDYAHSIAHAVQHKIKQSYPQAADVTVHIEPAHVQRADHPDVGRQLKAIAHSLGATAHEIWTHSINSSYSIELHLEVSPELSLAEAHDLASQLEDRGKQALPNVDDIITHIEPMGEMVEGFDLSIEGTIGILLTQAQEIAEEVCGADSCHNFQLWPENEGVSLSLHCALPSAMSIVEAHSISQRLELALRWRIPLLNRIVVHVEPPARKQA